MKKDLRYAVIILLLALSAYVGAVVVFLRIVPGVIVERPLFVASVIAMVAVAIYLVLSMLYGCYALLHGKNKLEIRLVMKVMLYIAFFTAFSVVDYFYTGLTAGWVAKVLSLVALVVLDVVCTVIYLMVETVCYMFCRDN